MRLDLPRYPAVTQINFQLDDVPPNGSGNLLGLNRAPAWFPPGQEADQCCAKIPVEPESCRGAAKAAKGLFYHQVSLAKPMISQPIILLQRQHGVELGGPGQAMGLVEMELREDIVSQAIYSCLISSPEISKTSGDLFLLLKFLHKIRFQRLAKISLHFALGVLDMDTIAQRFIGNWSLW